MEIAAGGMRARLAAGPGDLARVLALRRAAFPGDGPDPLDARADHLLIEGPGGALLAGARVSTLACGADWAGSYAARFYDLAALQADPRPVLELGRVALNPDPQGWQALRLLWAAVTARARAAGVARLIGCVSFAGADWRPHAPGLALLARDHLGPLGLRPGPRGAVVDYPRLVGAVTDLRTAQAALPPLLRFYLSLGAWVSDHAVADGDLDTLHVLTCLEVDRIPPARAARLAAT